MERMTHSLSSETGPPTLQEVMAGYRVFNDWERTELVQQLRYLTVAESVRQFLELCALARMAAPDADTTFLSQDKSHWITLRQKREKAARKMGYASTASSLTGSPDVS